MTAAVEPRDSFVDARGLTFHYVDWGDARSPAIVLLHGVTSQCRIWDPIAAALQDRCHVFAVDQRGHGQTSWPEDGDYSADAFVDDLEALVDYWEIDSFDLVGLSMGGMNGMQYAARHPQKVKHLVVVDIRPAINREKRPGRDLDKHIAEHGHPEMEGIDQAIKIARLTNQITPDDVLRYRLQHQMKQLDNGKWQNRHDARASYYWDPKNLWDELPKITVPTLIVRGGKSEVLQDKTVDDMLQAFPNARAVTVEEAGHTVPEDRMEEFIAVLEPFLAS